MTSRAIIVLMQVMWLEKKFSHMEKFKYLIHVIRYLDTKYNYTYVTESSSESFPVIAFFLLVVINDNIFFSWRSLKDEYRMYNKYVELCQIKWSDFYENTEYTKRINFI